VEVETHFFPDASAFEAWLEVGGNTCDGIWIRMAKKHSGIASLDWPAAVDVALCFGWIDGQRRRIDDDWFCQRFTPRRPRSIWSKINREKVERLVTEGRMRTAGLAEVERAKADGRWGQAYDGMATATVPDDLAAALDAAGLTQAFAALDGRTRYGILHRLQTAKRAETRRKHVTAFVELLARGV
jgi:uncharacterized protein YdeI (YjbR/CyaY-like superfamily)